MVNLFKSPQVYAVGAVAVAIVIALLYWGYRSYNAFVEPANFTADLQGSMVAVPDDTQPGQLQGWFFDPGTQLVTSVLDSRREDHRKVYYLQVSSKAKTGQTLNGILEAHYINIAGKPYLIALASITLKLEGPPQPTPAAPPLPVQPAQPAPAIQPAQRPPELL